VKKLLITALVLILSVGMIGSAFAYFSDTETSTGNTYTTGTLDMVLSDNDETEQDGVVATWVSPTGWKPGQEVSATLTMKNIGNIGSIFLFLKPVNIQEYDGDTPESEPASSANDMVNWINITDFMVTVVGPGGWIIGNQANSMATWGIWGTTAPLTLAEFASGSYNFLIWGATDSDYCLKASGVTTVTLDMTFKFNPDADNNYQGDYCTMDFRCVTGNEEPTSWGIIWEGSGGYGHGGL
jgi:predicted ribosomally synthesized peptide with SipW-like signal peptide